MRAAAALAVLAACGDGGAPPLYQVDGSVDAFVSGDVALEAGVAMRDGTGFVAVEDGDDAALVSGAQGGFHVWTALRVSGATGPLVVVRSARRAEDQALILRETAFTVEVGDEALTSVWQSPVALPSFMCPAPIGIAIQDQPIEITVDLRSKGDALLARDVMRVVPRCPEVDLDFCVSICNG